VRASAEICALGPESVYLVALPIGHNYPMSSPGFFGAIAAGSTVALTLSPSPDIAFPIIERERVTITGLVPPLALIWLDAAATTTADLSSLTVLQVGGAKLPPEVARRVRPTLGVTLQQVFGMAEGLVNYTRLDDPEERIVTTQGRPISQDDELLILDDEGNPVAEGESGHLLTRGPYTIRGYHNAPEANAEAFTNDGYYRTGDIVSLTPDGYLVVWGRSKDQINRGGEKVSAEEIEDHLLAHPQVHDAAVVSIPDPYLGEKACAFVIPRGEAPKGAVLKKWIRERGLAAFKVPDQIVFVESFPSTGVGKVSRKELRAALRAQVMSRSEGKSEIRS
jgi:2,3-dihydroxybenzoate-AMP ligase